MADPTRRAVLKGLSLSSLAVACGPPADPGVPEPRNPWPSVSWGGVGSPESASFPVGIQAGDPLADGIMLCTRYAGQGTLTAQLALWMDGAWVQLDPMPCTVEDGGFVHVDVRDLPSDTSVSYCFVDDAGKASGVALARTAMGVGSTGAVRFLLGSCNHIRHDPLPALSRAAASPELDFALHLGDTVYADGARTRAQYRTFWDRYLKMRGYQDVFAATAGVFTWDDHEFNNNFDPETFDPDHLQQSMQAFYETLPVRRNDTLWRKLAWGDIAEVFVLDCRTERRRSQGLYISEEQLAWLEQGLLESTATWKVIASSVPFTRFYGPMAARIATEDNWLGHGEGVQRQRLLDFIADNGIDGVLFAGGDIHMNLLARVEPEGPASRIFELIAGPGGSAINPLGPLYKPSDQFPYVDGVNNMFVVTLSSSGHAWVQVVGDEKDWMEATFDTRGHIGRIAFERSSDA